MMAYARALLVTLLLSLALLTVPEPVFAYGGPGSVISGIGTLLAALGALLAALFGFIWFPLKRLYQKLQGEEETTATAEADTTSE